MPAIPPLPTGIILLVEVGSTAHGTGLPGGEDHDELAVGLESATAVLGLRPGGPRSVMQRTQPEGYPSGPGDTDRTIHPLRRFLRLAASGNPSILMALWAPVLQSTPDGDGLRALGEAFVGRHLIARYRGYMQSQVGKLLASHDVGARRGQQHAHGWDTKYAMHAARLGFQGLELLTTARLVLPIQGETAAWLRAVRRGEVAFEEWQERTAALDADLARLAADERIPAGPDLTRVEAWSVATHLRAWESEKGRGT